MFTHPSLSGGWHGLVMIFTLWGCSSQIPRLPFVVGTRLRERSSFSITYGKQTNNYCPNDHLHNSNNSFGDYCTFTMLSLPFLKHLVHGRSQWKSALLNGKTFFLIKALIWSIRMALNKDNYVLFYCTDLPIITGKDAASFPLYFSSFWWKTGVAGPNVWESLWWFSPHCNRYTYICLDLIKPAISVLTQQR